MFSFSILDNEQGITEFRKAHPEIDVSMASGNLYADLSKLGTQPYPHSENKTPVTLIKVGEQQFMEKLIQEGEVYMQTLEHYRNLELEAKDFSDGRGDAYEGIDAINQVNQLSFGDKTFDTAFTLRCKSSKGIKGLVYSMYGVFDGSWVDGTFVLPECMKKMGDSMVVITDPMVFLDRCASAIFQLKGRLLARSVSYYDEQEGDYFLDPWLKRKQFSAQSEYRLFVPCAYNKPLALHIGALTDIAELVNFENRVAIH